MSEETTNTQENAQPAEDQNINISIEQILASILSTLGATTVTVENLIADYSKKQIQVNQNEDRSITFQLADVVEGNDESNPTV